MPTTVVTEIAQLDPAWLSFALGGDVGEVRWTPIGTGQIGACYRGELTGPGVRPGSSVPATIVAKLPTPDAALRPMLAGTYRTEVSFYRELADRVTARVPVCHYAAISDDASEFVLLLEDLSPGVQGDQLAGCTAPEAADCVRNLAGLHGPLWCDEKLLGTEWLYRSAGQDDADSMTEVMVGATEIFIERFTGRLSAEDQVTLRTAAELMGRWIIARDERFAPIHGDYRLDNLILGASGPAGVAAVDWQTLTIGLPARDLAYCLGTGLKVPDRRAAEHELVAAYHRELTGHGVTGHSFDECWDDYRFAFLQGPLITVLGCAYGTPTERGDQMFLEMTERCCAAIRDHGSLDMVTS